MFTYIFELFNQKKKNQNQNQLFKSLTSKVSAF